jgi:tetratricopeptide (TPR) repeat protein
VIALEGGDPKLHAKLAALLAHDGQSFDAWRHFQSAARSWLRAGHADEALAVYRKAVQCLPRTAEAWLELGDLHRREGRRREAVEALREGRRHLRRRRYRAEATHLLRCAHALEPGNLDVTLDLVRMLTRSRQQREAVVLLEDLAARCAPGELRRVRRAMFQVTPSPAAMWRWLQSVFLPPPRRHGSAAVRARSQATGGS